MAWITNGLDKGMTTCPWAPRPTGAAPDRHVVHSEANHGKEDSNERSKDDIKAMVSMVEPTGRGNEERNCDWHQRDDHCIYRGRSSLFSDMGTSLSRTRLGVRVCEYSIFCATSRLRCEWVRRKIGEADGELGTQPEGEIRQSCERDWIGQS